MVTAEGLVGGALGVVYARLRGGDRGPLTGLLDELMGMIVLQYLGPRAARREQRRPAPVVRPVSLDERVSLGAERDPLDEVDISSLRPTTPPSPAAPIASATTRSASASMTSTA